MADDERELGTYWRDKAREILTMYGKHGTDMGLCDSYYCGQECSYLSAVGDQDGNLLREMAGDEWVKEWETRLLEWSLCALEWS